MILTLNGIFNDSNVISAIIDRVNQTEKDKIYWKDYLDFEQTNSRLFKTYLGTVTGVTMGSIIDKNSNKPIRERKSLGSGVGEVAILGNSWQLDNDRLDQLKSLIEKFNDAKSFDKKGSEDGLKDEKGNPTKSAVMNEIIDFLADDIRQATLAPHKRMDYVLGQLRSTGVATVKFADNPQGIEVLEMEIPAIKETPDASVKDAFINYLRTKVDALKPIVGNYGVMEMTRTTFNKRIAGSAEFQNAYKMILGNSEIAVSGGLLTDAMASQLLTGIGLPNIKIVEEFVAKEDGTTVNTFADDRITFLPAGKLGKMKWHTPYEITDPVPNKIYTQLEGGHFISTERTNEGRFIEYMAEWIPDLTSPNKIAIFDTSNLG